MWSGKGRHFVKEVKWAQGLSWSVALPFNSHVLWHFAQLQHWELLVGPLQPKTVLEESPQGRKPSDNYPNYVPRQQNSTGKSEVRKVCVVNEKRTNKIISKSAWENRVLFEISTACTVTLRRLKRALSNFPGYIQNFLTVPDYSHDFVWNGNNLFLCCIQKALVLWPKLVVEVIFSHLFFPVHDSSPLRLPVVTYTAFRGE